MENFSLQVLLNSRIKVKQHYKYDCGAACLASVAAYYGVSVSLAHIRMTSGCTPQGISVQGIIDAATTLGFQANGYLSKEKDIRQITQLQLPAIAHLKDSDGYLHYVVIYSAGAKHFKIMDPAQGKMTNVAAGDFSAMWTGYIIKVVPSCTLPRAEGEEDSLKLIRQLIKGNLKELMLAFAGTVLCICCGMATTLLLQQSIDIIIPSGEKHLLWIAIPVLTCLMILSLHIGYRTTGYIIKCSIKVESSLIAAYIWKLFKLPAQFFSNYSAGDISSRCDDIHLIRSFITGGIIGIAASGITVTSTIVIMLLYNVRLASMVLCLLPLYWILYRTAGKIGSKWGKAVAVANSRFEESLLEGVSSVQCAKDYNACKKISEKIEGRYIHLAEVLQESAHTANKFEICVQGVSKLLICVVLCFGTLAVFNGSMTLGELAGFYSLCSFFTVPLDDMISSVNSMAKAKVAVRRIHEILSIQEYDKSKESISPSGIEGNIEVKGLKFKYPGRALLFNGIDIKFEKGKITRIEGGNGTGKSTLLKLIKGDYSPTEGNISYSGINIGQLNSKKWREMTGYVAQRPSVLNASILENIAMGDDTPCIGRILQICRDLNMEDMIDKFPQGLLTCAGDGGVMLSGGECQKIGIARALYKDPPIFILDEATSSMDRESEEIVAQCIHKLRDCGKTIIMVSHKRESAIIADNVVKINKTGLEW